MVRAIGRRRGTFALVVLEFTLAFTIISSLFLTGAWYQRVAGVRSGAHHRDLIHVALQRPPTGERAPAWQARMAALIAQTPGVVASAPVSATLIDDALDYPSVIAGDATTNGWVVHTGARLPEVLGMRFVEGQAPAEPLPGAVVLTRCLRDQLFPGGLPALGRPIKCANGGSGTVVGVVEDLYLRHPWMGHTECLAFYFTGATSERQARHLVRSAPGQRAAVAAALQRRLAPLAGGDGYLAITLYDPQNARSPRIVHGVIVNLTIFGLNVALVALLGPLAVASFLVAERTRQIGVRRALGATRGAIIRYFLVENSLAVALGTALGGVITLALFAAMRARFYGITLRPWTLVVAAVLLWVDGTAAALVPAFRAARVPPWVAARST
jgi:hypothetical protein